MPILSYRQNEYGKEKNKYYSKRAAKVMHEFKVGTISHEANKGITEKT